MSSFLYKPRPSISPKLQTQPDHPPSSSSSAHYYFSPRNKRESQWRLPFPLLPSFLGHRSFLEDRTPSARRLHLHAQHRSTPSQSQWPQPRHACHDNDATGGERGHHFLYPCGRCSRLLGRNKDIFMYRGDTPFCSEECRQQEMDADEAKERRRSSCKLPAAAAASKRGCKQPRQSSDPQTIHVWALSIVS